MWLSVTHPDYPLQLLGEGGLEHSEGQEVRVGQPQIHLVSFSLFHLKQAEQISNSPSTEGENTIMIQNIKYTYILKYYCVC